MVLMYIALLGGCIFDKDWTRLMPLWFAATWALGWRFGFDMVASCTGMGSWAEGDIGDTSLVGGVFLNGLERSYCCVLP